MSRELEHILAEIRRGGAPACLLVHGDDFQVREATKAILDLVAPERDRSFNLERFDGRTTPWNQIEASLMTPPLFAANKTVLIENTPYFLSREHKADLREQTLQLWRQGKEEDAARQFLDLLLSAGWTQERWEKLPTPLGADDLEELFGEERDEVRDQAEGLVEFCRARGWTLPQRSDGEGQRLVELLEHGLPPWAFVLMTAARVDRRSRLYKRFADRKASLDLALAREKSGRISSEVLHDFVRQRLEQAGKRIEAEARELIVARAGEELWAVHQELEKLLLYVGESPWIRLADVMEVCLDLAEGWVFGLTQAIAARDSLAALGHLERLLSEGDHPLMLLSVIASEVRRILAARQLLEGDFRQTWRGQMSFEQFQRTVLRNGPPVLTRNPYADYMALKSADMFSTAELVRDLQRIVHADIRLKSTSLPPRLVLERLVLEMCRGQA